MTPWGVRTISLALREGGKSQERKPERGGYSPNHDAEQHLQAFGDLPPQGTFYPDQEETEEG